MFIEDIVCVDSGNKSSDLSAQTAVAVPDSDAFGSGELPPGCMKLSMIAATEMSAEPFKAFEFDGVLGLGLAGLSHKTVRSYVFSSPGFFVRDNSRYQWRQPFAGRSKVLSCDGHFGFGICRQNISSRQDRNLFKSWSFVATKINGI